MFAHMDCYGVRQAPHGGHWLCDPCALGLPAPPPCALCPVAGGALKRSTCGRWAHVACALWFEEARLRPELGVHGVLAGLVEGLPAVHASRFRLKCALCAQPHGACVQCCAERCYTGMHPLCARAARDCLTQVWGRRGGGGLVPKVVHCPWPLLHGP